MSKNQFQIEEIEPGWVRLTTPDRQIDLRLADVVSVDWASDGPSGGDLLIGLRHASAVACEMHRGAANALCQRWRAWHRDRDARRAARDRAGAA